MAFNQDLKALKITGPIDQDYLFHFLSGKEAYFISRGNGATVKGFKVDDIRTIPFDPPPLPTQRRIAAVLDKTQALVANDRRTLAVYDQLAKSLFLEMFGDPVRNERGWEIVTVSDVGTARLGKMLDAKKRTGLNPRPYLRNTNVQWRRIELHDLHEMDFDEKDRNEFALKKGDILMCEGGEVGRCGIWKGELEECYFQKAIHRIRLDPKMITAEFFVRLFMELVERNGLKDYVTTSTISHLTGEKLATVRIPLPPLKDQLRFERTIEVIEAQRILAETSLRRSEGLFGSLLQQAFAGGLG
jgi:type I restriction enzyme S subunit